MGDWLEFPDHCRFEATDVRRLEQWLAAADQASAVICTQKDLVKIPRDQIAGRRLLALQIDLEIAQGQSEFEALLKRTVAPLCVQV